ncbi:MAG: 23S rRNA (adenine(2503)-C(2))-methyltransferase RlmN [Myxococcota bacterium]
MSRELLGFTLDEVEAIAREAMPSGHGVAKALYRRAIAEGVFRPEDTGISEAAVAAWRALFQLNLPRVVRLSDEDDAEGRSTIKAVLAAPDGLEYECVRIPMGEGRTTLCVSSQVGCKMGCTFCETGKMGLLRNLSAAEIVGQLIVARAVLGWSVDKIVFMGMGEALDNFEALDRALIILNDRKGIQLGMQRITICTVGNAEGLEKLAARGYKRLSLSVSLNAANDPLRSSMMPINKKIPLARLKEAMQRYPVRRSFVWAVNYCLLPGINDRREDLDDVARFFDGLGRAVLNLIPYNPGSSPVSRAPTEEEISAFTAGLKERGVLVTRRVTRGRSVMAACGQLGNVELRRPARGRS